MIETVERESLIGKFVYCTTQRYSSGTVCNESDEHIFIESSDGATQEILVEEFNFHFVIGE